MERANAVSFFDIMSFAYYPPAYWDPRLHTEFVNKYSRDWEWTTMGSVPLTMERVLRGDHKNVRAIPLWHKFHCLYE